MHFPSFVEGSMVSLAGREVETLCHQARASSSHEALAGVCESQEWWESGMALSGISLRRHLCEGIAIWLLSSHRSFGDVSAAQEATMPVCCPAVPTFTRLCLCPLQNSVVLACPQAGPDASFFCPLGTQYYLKSFFSP